MAHDETPKKPLTGRPPIAPEDRRKALIKVLTTEAEHEQLRNVAEAAHMTVSTWVRIAALEKAAQAKREAAPAQPEAAPGKQDAADAKPSA